MHGGRRDFIPVTQPTIPVGVQREYADVVKQIIDSRMLSNWGEWNEQFEKGLAKATGAPTLTFPSGDSALIAMLAAMRMPPGSIVAVPSFTFNSTANAVLWNHLGLRFMDVSPETLVSGPKDMLVGDDDRNRSSAFLATHTFGVPCDITGTHFNGRPILFDGAHALGACADGGVPVGSTGFATSFSFSGTKILTCGEGGAVATKNKTLLRRLRYIRNYGFWKDYRTRFQGFNGKMSEFHAALGTLLFPNFRGFVENRRRLAWRYISLLWPLSDGAALEIPGATEPGRVWNNFAIIIEDADRVHKRLAKAGIQTKRYFRPLHRMPFYGSDAVLPRTDFVAKRILVLPLFAHMTDGQQDRVVAELKKAVKPR